MSLLWTSVVVLSVTNTENTSTNQITGNQNWCQRACGIFQMGIVKNYSLEISLFIQELCKIAILSPECCVGNIFTEV